MIESLATYSVMVRYLSHQDGWRCEYHTIRAVTAEAAKAQAIAKSKKWTGSTQHETEITLS